MHRRPSCRPPPGPLQTSRIEIEASSSPSPKKTSRYPTAGVVTVFSHSRNFRAGEIRLRALAPASLLNRGGRNPRQTHLGVVIHPVRGLFARCHRYMAHPGGRQSHCRQLLRWRMRFRQYLEIYPVMYHGGTRDLQSQPTSLPLQRDECYYRGWPLRSASRGEQASLIRKEVSWMLPVSAPAGH